MSDQNWWEYEQLQSGEPYEWGGAARGGKPWDNIDFHLDLGCGTVPKGRLGIDRFYAPEVGLLLDLSGIGPVGRGLVLPGDEAAEAVYDRTIDLYLKRSHEAGWTVERGLPFPDNSIESIISHHFFEHLHGEDAIKLMDECYRVLKPGGILRIIVPAFPSVSAIADLDHKSYWMPQTFEQFCGTSDGRSWLESFSVPYTSCRFEKLEVDMTEMTPPELQWVDGDNREIRAALRKWGS